MILSKRLKLALLALLGFSTACSSVKEARRGSADKRGETSEAAAAFATLEAAAEPAADTTERKVPSRLVLMYGVRTPAYPFVEDPVRADTLGIKPQTPAGQPAAPDPEPPASDDAAQQR